jgi:precorrin-8X/cobalt-precorrin-8 methylmutase
VQPSNLSPAEIAQASFSLIRNRLQAEGHTFTGTHAALLERVIHSTADFDFVHLLRLSPGAIEAGLAALQQGCPVIADVNMVRVGISATRLGALGGAVHCFVAEPETRTLATAGGITRSAAAIRIAAERGLLQGALVAIGNAPTALLEILRLIEAGCRPALVIGAPVGFVGTVESKATLMAQNTVPWIVTTGYKGGSPVAVAIVNALLRLAAGATAEEID